IILPVVLYGCETWSLTFREELRGVRRIFGQKRDEVTGGWRKLHNEELHNLYSSPSIIGIRILARKPEGKRQLREPRYKWVENIKKDGMAWIYLAQNRDQWIALVNTVMNIRIP
ncbi:hypothetical protein B7P43_G15306, partial [Cryptotermes secundus]